MTDVEKSLAQVASAAKRLNEKSDSINERIRRVENALRESNAGLEFGYYRAFDRDNCLSYYLTYSKTHDWCLQVREYRRNVPNEDPNEYEPAMLIDKEELDHMNSVWESETPLLQCSRPIRIAALAALPAFLDAYRVAIESAIETVERAEEALK